MNMVVLTLKRKISLLFKSIPIPIENNLTLILEEQGFVDVLLFGFFTDVLVQGHKGHLKNKEKSVCHFSCPISNKMMMDRSMTDL